MCLLINHIILIKRLFFHLGVNEMFFEELLRILIQCQDLFEIISALKTLGVFVLHVNQRSVNLLEVKLKNFSIDFLFELRKFLYDLVPIFLGYSIPPYFCMCSHQEHLSCFLYHFKTPNNCTTAKSAPEQ